MKMLNFTPEMANKEYKIAHDLAGEDMIKMIRESRLAQKKVTFDYLTDSGKDELEFILMYLHKK